MALQPVLQQLNNCRTPEGLQLVYSFLDDLILAGDEIAVSQAFHFLKAEALNIGLEFNTTKCEIIPASGNNAVLNKNLFPEDIIYRDDGNFELLGGPIGSEIFCNHYTQE